MNVFELRNHVVEEYGKYVKSFLTIRDPRIDQLVSREMAEGFLWPDPLIQLNPAFERGDTLHELVDGDLLHPECLNIFREKKEDGTIGSPFRLHRHQVEGVRAANAGQNYVLTTGTGSGKSLAYIVPIVDHVLRAGSGKGIKAIIVYPMNALANSQIGELEKFLCRGYPQGHPPVTFKRYTGQESDEERKAIVENPPDILLTNYMMLELVLTRPWDYQLIDAASNLQFLVLDELHTYRGRQGADVAMLVRRLREATQSKQMLHIGTSATLAGGGSWEDQQREVAEVASLIFGATVEPEWVIGETLRRVTPYHPSNDPGFVEALRSRIESGTTPLHGDTDAFLADPLASWIESTLGLTRESGSDRLVRCKPRPLIGRNGVVPELAKATGLDPERCTTALRDMLLTGYNCRDEDDRPIFAFRLHQLVSKGESVYGSLETEDHRHITLQPQQFVPGSQRAKILLPMAFCRECGQEYYVVRRGQDENERTLYLPREVSDRFDNDDGDSGYLYLSDREPWPDDPEEIVERLPDAWLETRNGLQVVKKGQRKYLPRKVLVSTTGIENAGERTAWWMGAPFRFCLCCGVAYDAHQQSDFGKLATLGSEGRSTATTIMTLSTIRRLRNEAELDDTARKLLSFTDNRQDASLQAGHFNDFVEIVLLRSALWRAAEGAGSEGLRHDILTLRVFEALNLDISQYAVDPNVQYAAKDETDRALREVLGYYLYRDLRRGWRITSPNLEQSGLLDIDYLSLAEFCADDPHWQNCHPALVSASTGDREKVATVLLDYFRRELSIRVDFLDPVYQERIAQLSNQRLLPPWALDENDDLERSRIVFPRSREVEQRETRHFVYLSPRGGFGLFLKRPGTFQDWDEPLKTEDVEHILRDLCEKLVIPGLLHRALDPRDDEDVPGYQLNASAMIWRPGTGSSAFHDPIRVPRKPEEGLRTNPFFTEFYQSDTGDIKNLTAREHTAQVKADIREERETRFRDARLPILYCSPTMELGVDIAQLNVVNMRNIPPTPANYAQRSGRAGRSGQPAFVYSYCTVGSPHDQYFFKHPELMVAGAVSAPRLDLINEELLKAHVHAIWLQVAKFNLGSSLSEVLDVSGDTPSLKALPRTEEALNHHGHRREARKLAWAALNESIRDLVAPDGDPETWLDRVLENIPVSFENACRRWRELYMAALNQSKRQQRIILDPTRDPRDRATAKRLRGEAESQLRLLLESTSNSQHSDFYSYRYFASEGFLPGYNFPRLPLSAYLPGQRKSRDGQDFLSRPRFLAISEFGPQSIIYYEGSRFVVNKVILPVEEGEQTITRRAIQCTTCGYIHPLKDEPGPDLCESCRAPLPPAYENLFRMQNAATKRRDRINSDEEERFRLGYDLKTGIRFARRGGQASSQLAQLTGRDEEELATFSYGHGATLWRMNLGWRRRRNQEEVGFVLDVERGYWKSNRDLYDDPEDPLSPRTQRVIPYVEDTRNGIVVRPASRPPREVMASLEAALKTAIQVYFQIEDRELATEPMPGPDDRQYILLYEAAEGGAGVLRRLVEDPLVIPAIARLALDICHFDPDSGEDLHRAPGAMEDCEAACYDCLLSYFNQRDHRLLDRHLLRGLLLDWAGGSVSTSPRSSSREDVIKGLLNLCDSHLEKRWLHLVDSLDLRLPGKAQALIEDCGVRPDYLYPDQGVAVFIDGPVHDGDRQQDDDARKQDCLEDLGYTVIRFRYDDDWEAIFRQYPNLFGRLPGAYTADREEETEVEDAPDQRYDPDDFDEEWHPLLDALTAHADLEIEPGSEVMKEGRVLDLDLATIHMDGQTIRLVDGRRPTAAELHALLLEEGEKVLLVMPDQTGVDVEILNALRSE